MKETGIGWNVPLGVTTAPAIAFDPPWRTITLDHLAAEERIKARQAVAAMDSNASGEGGATTPPKV